MSTDAATGAGTAAAKAAADTIRARLGVRDPVAAIVLGSGLGELAARIENPASVRYADIPGFHATSVAGHRGELIRGTLGGREVLALAGRFHMYEGHGARTAAYPIRVLHALGAKLWSRSRPPDAVYAFCLERRRAEP